ncbi:molecular chaperone [Brenneria goodwinii]|uniref:Molecular chaperone n=1 Tax=Brenneria goodwinii TaxID=1109412 RepID=A0AAE8EMI2_9GAMM|nr:molecular chaperone [Brenneria goodwinii]ATA24805.1 molecular chaperone [Brenneria goodwinii]RLM21313.1 molecular chaperone [Brenneria goodwinii]
MNQRCYCLLPGLLLASSVLFLPASRAAINLDRTRVVFDGAEQSSTVTLINENRTNPFLAQSWLVDSNHNKVSAPLTVLPPLQRIEAGGRTLIRVVKSSGVDKLPQDRESLFYLNVREIPPKPEKENVLQIAVQSEIKVFYRPSTIKPGRNDIWQTQLKIKKAGKQFIVENPTPYFITVSNILKQSKEKSSNPVHLLTGKAFMIEPKSVMNVNVADSSVQEFYLYYVNDYGGHPELHFVCRQNTCAVAQKN